MNNCEPVTTTGSQSCERTLTLQTQREQEIPRHINPNNLPGTPGQVLKACAAQLAGILIRLFNLSSLQAVTTCLKSATVVPLWSPSDQPSITYSTYPSGSWGSWSQSLLTSGRAGIQPGQVTNLSQGWQPTVLTTAPTLPSLWEGVLHKVTKCLWTVVLFH